MRYLSSERHHKKIYRKLRRRADLLQTAEIERFSVHSGEGRLQAHGKKRKLPYTVGVTLHKKCTQQVSNQEMLLCWFPHTPVETHLSLPYDVSQSRSQFLRQHSIFSNGGEGNLYKTKYRINLEDQEKYLRSCQPNGLAQNNPNNICVTHT